MDNTLKLYIKHPDDIVKEKGQGWDYNKLIKTKRRRFANKLARINSEYLTSKRAMEIVKVQLKSENKRMFQQYITKRWDKMLFKFPKLMFITGPIYLPYYLVNESLIHVLSQSEIKLIEVTKYKQEDVKQELISELKLLFLSVSNKNKETEFSKYLDQWVKRLIKENCQKGN